MGDRHGAGKHEDFLLALHGCWFTLAELDGITSKEEAGELKNACLRRRTTFVFRTVERMTRSRAKAFL